MSIKLKTTSNGSVSLTPEDTASDVVLTVPAGDGDLVSETATDKAFKQSNILGTVSQSGGVPTGAIIERGSNANGEFVRYADGTMICSFGTPTNINTSTAIGSVAKSSTQTISFPANFIAAPQISATATIGGQANGFGVSLGNIGTSSVQFFCWGVNTSQSAAVRFNVIGRWY